MSVTFAKIQISHSLMLHKGLLIPRLMYRFNGKSQEECRHKSKTKKILKLNIPARRIGIHPDQNWIVSCAGVTVHIALVHASLAEHHSASLLLAQSLC